MIRPALRGLATRRLRTVLTGLAIALGVGLVTAAMLLGDTIRNGSDQLRESAYGGTNAAIVAKTPADAGDFGTQPTVPESLLGSISNLPQVRTASGDITDQQTKLIGDDGKVLGAGPYFGVGLDPKRSQSLLDPFHIVSGHFAYGADQVVIDEGTASKEGLAVGDKIEVAARGPVRTMTISGLVKFGTVSALGTATVSVFDMPTAQRLLGRTNAYDSILVAAKPGVSTPQLDAAIEKVLPANMRVESADTADRFNLDGLNQAVSFITTALAIFAGIAVMVGGFTIFNALSITTAQRTKELGLARSLGGSRGQIMRSVLAEALVLSMVASAIGIGLGFAIAAGVGSIMVSSGLDLPKASATLSAGSVAAALCVGIGVTVLASLIPARRSMRVAPVEAIRDGGPTSARLTRRARLVRALLSVLGRPSERVGGEAGMLARRNAMRNPGRTGASASALAIGLALVVAITVVANGLKDTATGSVKDQIRSEYVLESSDNYSPIDPAAAKAVAATPGVSSVSRLTQGQATAFGSKIGVNGVDPKTIADGFAYDWRDGSDAALAGMRNDEAIVSSSFADDHHLAVGDRLGVNTPKAGRIGLRVVAIQTPGKLNVLQLGDVTLADTEFAKAFQTGLDQLALVSTDGSASQASITAALAKFPSVKAETPDGFATSQTAWVQQALTVVYALLALSALISVFGIVNMMALVVLERTRELGILRANGMSRRQLRRMVRHEGVITAMVGATLGTIAGLAIAAVITAKFSSDGLSFAVPVGSLVTFAVIAAIAGVAAGSGPARRAARISPLTALHYE